MSDSESDLERVSSVKSIPESYETVPFPIDFKFKVGIEDIFSSTVKFAFLLKKDKELPYNTTTTTKKGKGVF